MGKKDVLTILRRFRDALEAKKIHVQKMILFGSWARGTAGEHSDIDVVIVSEAFNGQDLWSRAKLLGSAAAASHIRGPIQPLALTPEEWEGKTSTVCELAQDGEVVAV